MTTTTTAAPVARPVGSARRAWTRRGWALLFLLPSAVPLVLFTALPMVSSIWVSLHEWNLISPARWVGLDNYAALLADPRTADVFRNTLLYLVGYLPLVYVGGMGLALLRSSGRPTSCRW